MIDTTMGSRKFLWIGLAVVAAIVLVGAVLWSRGSKYNMEQPLPKHSDKAPSFQKQDVDKAKLPEKFPADIPRASETFVIQNYNATSADGQFQATRVFNSSSSLQSSFTTYQAYLKSHGYVVGATVDQPNYKYVTGSKGKTQLQITCQLDKTTEKNMVSITFIELKK